MAKTKTKFMGIALEDVVHYGGTKLRCMPLVCGILNDSDSQGCKRDNLKGCGGCIAFEEDKEIGAQVWAILNGLA